MNGLFDQALTGDNAIGHALGRLAAKEHPGKFVLDGVGSPFDLEEYAAEGKCEAKLAEGVHAQMSTHWTREHGLATSPVNAIYDVRWEGHSLRVIVATWSIAWNRNQVSLVIADSEKVARAFAEAVCAFCNDPRRSVLLYSGGCWSKSHEVWQSIQDASFDDLILAGDLKQRIQEDFTTFMAARADYARYGVPYKRGVLFLGPPGNGKTLCLRAAIKLLEVPCLYVMSLKSKYSPEDSNIEEVFKRARQVTPCCLVFEDLDAMIHDKNRSFFLNQLDGIGNLSGVLTLATTNHPERLDPAIVERPSRFDRKYHFGLPAVPERKAYLERWNKKLDDAMRISDAEIERLVEETTDFSFAYLKELYLSAMVRWMVERKAGTMLGILMAQLETLREQMRTTSSVGPGPLTEPDLDD